MAIRSTDGVRRLARIKGMAKLDPPQKNGHCQNDELECVGGLEVEGRQRRRTVVEKSGARAARNGVHVSQSGLQGRTVERG